MEDIEGFEDLYAATKEGKIWAYPKLGYSNSGRWKEGRFLKPWLIGHGYETVSLYQKGKTFKYLVHRLVAKTFIPNPNSLREVNHKDADKRNNRIENLEWVSSKENKQHAIKRGLYRDHEILTEKQVREIREKYKTGLYRQVDLGREYKTTQVNISWIVRNKGWFHVI